MFDIVVSLQLVIAPAGCTGHCEQSNTQSSQLSVDSPYKSVNLKTEVKDKIAKRLLACP